jgi:hypothetical protein
MGRMKMIPMNISIPFAATGTTFSVPLLDNGWIAAMQIVVPTLTNGSVTATVTVVDALGNTWFNSGALASNTTTTLGDLITAGMKGEIPVSDAAWKFTVTLSGDAGDAGNMQIYACLKV